MAKSTPNPAKEPASYEQALAELDRLVDQMEQGQLPLDRLLDDYRRGAELLAYCRGKLEAVEEQVRVLEAGRLERLPNSSSLSSTSSPSNASSSSTS